MGLPLQKIDGKGAAARKLLKRSMARHNRQAAKRDPENAQRKHEYKGWLT